jgi:hypothetical protein
MQIASPDGGAATGGTVSHAKVATAPDSAPGQVSVADAQGKIRFTCAKCGFHAKLAASYAGKAISCPGCQAPQLIPPLVEAHDSAGGAATPAVTPAAALTSPSEAPGITVDDTSPFDDQAVEAAGSGTAIAPRPPAAKAPASAISPSPSKQPLAPAAAAALPSGVPGMGGGDAPADAGDERPARSLSSSGKPKRGLSSVATPVPGKGVIRRGGKAGAALAAEEEAAAIAEEDAALEEEEEERTVPKELPAILKPLEPYLVHLREPKVMALVGAVVVALILEVCLIVAWRSAAGDVAKLRPQLATAMKSLEETQDKLTHALYDVGAQTSRADKAAEKLQQGQAALAESQKDAENQKAKAKQAEIDHQKEYDQRKAAETKLDATLDKLSKAVQARDDDYKKRVEAEKARDEESRLRKELKDKLDELAKAPK